MDNRCIKDNTVYLKKQGEKSTGGREKTEEHEQWMEELYSCPGVVR